jgi:hypothetical protein
MQNAIYGDNDSSNIEIGLIRDGYPSLATWIARDSDYEAYIFRRFDRLAARNILNLQSQLIQIEEQLDKLDESSRARRDIGLRRWESFTENASAARHQDDEARSQLYSDLDEKMKSYRKILPVPMPGCAVS